MIRKAGFWLLLATLLSLWAFRDLLFKPELVIAESARAMDGDTLSIKGKAWRLYGIDAPEYRQTCKDAQARDWPCGKTARAQLAALVLPGSIVCEPQASDSYGRPVARCASATIPDLAEALVQAGLAISPAERGRAPYEHAEASAREAKRGIWAGTFQAPAQWRAQNPRKD